MTFNGERWPTAEHAQEAQVGRTRSPISLNFLDDKGNCWNRTMREIFEYTIGSTGGKVAGARLGRLWVVQVMYE